MEKICLKCELVQPCPEGSDIGYHVCNSGCHDGMWIGQPNMKWLCVNCKNDYIFWIKSRIDEYILVNSQPERSKREDSKCFQCLMIKRLSKEDSTLALQMTEEYVKNPSKSWCCCKH